MLVMHAARVGMAGVHPSLVSMAARGELPAEAEWSALLRLGLYGWWYDRDPDGPRRDTNRRSADMLLAMQEECANDLREAAAATGSMGGLWLKAMASRQPQWDMYPQPWMRVATDVDVWFEEAEIPVLARWLVANRGYEFGLQQTPWPRNYELAMVSPEGIVVELHAALGPRRWPVNLFGRITPEMVALRCIGQIQSLSMPMQLVHGVVHLFQHAGHLKYFQLMELLLLLERDRDGRAEVMLLRWGYGSLWAWMVLRLLRLWPDPGDAPDFLAQRWHNVGRVHRALWSAALDEHGIWRGPAQMRGPKILALLT